MRSLSTSQLVVLWYGGIIISFILWDNYEDLYKVLAVSVLTGLLIYTLNPHPNANKRQVFFWVVLPVPLTLGLIYGGDWVYDQYKEKACDLALAKITAEEKNAELDIEGLGRELKRTLQNPTSFSKSQLSDDLESLRHDILRTPKSVKAFENELTEQIPAFDNCTYSKKLEVAEHWVKKFRKGAN